MSVNMYIYLAHRVYGALKAVLFNIVNPQNNYCVCYLIRLQREGTVSLWQREKAKLVKDINSK